MQEIFWSLMAPLAMCEAFLLSLIVVLLVSWRQPAWLLLPLGLSVWIGLGWSCPPVVPGNLCSWE